LELERIGVLGIAASVVFVALFVFYFKTKLQKEREETYKKVRKANIGRPMSRNELVSYYIFPNKSFKVLGVCERFLRVELTRLDDPDSDAEYFIEFDSEKTLTEVESGRWYKINRCGKLIQGSKF